MKTAFGRSFLGHMVILLAALLLTGASFQILVRNHLDNETIDALKNDSQVISRVAAAYLSETELDGRDFLMTLSVAGTISEADAVICDKEGRLIMCSANPLGCEHQGMQLSNPTYLQALQKQEYVVDIGLVEGLYPDNRYVVSTAIRNEQTGELYGLVMVSSPTEDTQSLMRQLFRSYMIVSVLVVITAVIVMTLHARNSSSPLRDMAKTATSFGHGDLKARVEVPQRAPQEIRELALAFNNMATAIEKTESQHREFVANVSHELKTPMTSISGYVDGILDGTIPKEQQEKYLLLMSDETKRLSRLVRSMLDISQLQEQGIDESRRTNFDVCECAGQVLISFEQKITQKSLEVEVTMPDYPVYTFADWDAITQVIYNLTDNAVKFTPQGGSLSMEIHHDDRKVYVSIANSGPTIPPEELPLLFERFHKQDKSRSVNRDSWGLGLYIVKTIVCSHGEDISVTSQNQKTEFSFTLPVVN